MKLIVHFPVQGGTANPRRVLTLCWPLLRETLAGVAGKEVFGKSSLITAPISGWMTSERGVRSGNAKPEMRVERIEMMAMRVNFIVDSR